MFLLNFGLNLTILGGAEPRILVNNLGTSSERQCSGMDPHRFPSFMEISLIFHYKYIFNNKKKLNLENSLDERDFK